MQCNLAPNFYLGRSCGICVALAHILRNWKRRGPSCVAFVAFGASRPAHRRVYVCSVFSVLLSFYKRSASPFRASRLERLARLRLPRLRLERSV